MGRALLNALTLSGDALLAAFLAPRCVCCRIALESPLGGPVCQRCWEDTRAADGRYTGALREIIHGLKYRRAPLAGAAAGRAAA